MIGIFDLISVLAQKMNRPVIGLNWTRQLNSFDSLKHIVDYYYEIITKMVETDPNNDGTYDLLALDFGALLAALMCKRKKNEKNLKIKRMACIDILPFTSDSIHLAAIDNVRHTTIDNDNKNSNSSNNNNDNVGVESMIDDKMLSDYKVKMIFDYIRLYIPERICDKSQKEVLELNCPKARITKITELLRKCVGTSLQGNDMAEIIEKDFRAVEVAQKAMENLSITPIIEPIRGGTDGSKISFMGLPTPNIFAGGENFHGRYEFVAVESMEKARDVIIEIVQLLAK